MIERKMTFAAARKVARGHVRADRVKNLRSYSQYPTDYDESDSLIDAPTPTHSAAKPVVGSPGRVRRKSLTAAHSIEDKAPGQQRKSRLEVEAALQNWIASYCTIHGDSRVRRQNLASDSYLESQLEEYFNSFTSIISRHRADESRISSARPAADQPMMIHFLVEGVAITVFIPPIGDARFSSCPNPMNPHPMLVRVSGLYQAPSGDVVYWGQEVLRCVVLCSRILFDDLMSGKDRVVELTLQGRITVLGDVNLLQAIQPWLVEAGKELEDNFSPTTRGMDIPRFLMEDLKRKDTEDAAGTFWPAFQGYVANAVRCLLICKPRADEAESPRCGAARPRSTAYAQQSDARRDPRKLSGIAESNSIIDSP